MLSSQEAMEAHRAAFRRERPGRPDPSDRSATTAHRHRSHTRRPQAPNPRSLRLRAPTPDASPPTTTDPAVALARRHHMGADRGTRPRRSHQDPPPYALTERSGHDFDVASPATRCRMSDIVSRLGAIGGEYPREQEGRCQARPSAASCVSPRNATTSSGLAPAAPTSLQSAPSRARGVADELPVRE